MRRVVIESPYKGDTPEKTRDNVDYARACMKDSLSRGEAPIASHLLYTQPGVLDDRIAEEREKGIQAGFVWNRLADAIVVYLDRGLSDGMKQGLRLAQEHRIPIEFRYLFGRG